MADRVAASIELGGVLSALNYRKLCETIENEGLSIEWDGEPFEAHHRIEGQSLCLYAYEVAWGKFDMLETLCVMMGLPFVRWSGAYPGQFGAERVVFTGTGEPQTYPADEDDYVVIGRHMVEKLGSLEAIIAYFDAADFKVPPLVVEDELIEVDA